MDTPFDPKSITPLPYVESAARAWAEAFNRAVEARNLDWYDPEAVSDDAANAHKLVGATMSPAEAARVYCEEPNTPWVDQARSMPGTNFA